MKENFQVVIHTHSHKTTKVVGTMYKSFETLKDVVEFIETYEKSDLLHYMTWTIQPIKVIENE